jgi:hypothetical protein
VGRKDGERIDNGAAISSGGSSTHAFFSPRLGIGGVFFLVSFASCLCYDMLRGYNYYSRTHHTHTHILYIHLHTHTHTHTHTHYANYCRFDMRSLHDEQTFILFLSPAFNATGTHWYQYHQSAAESPPAPELLYCPKNQSDRQAASSMAGCLAGCPLYTWWMYDRRCVRPKNARATLASRIERAIVSCFYLSRVGLICLSVSVSVGMTASGHEGGRLL